MTTKTIRVCSKVPLNFPNWPAEIKLPSLNTVTTCVTLFGNDLYHETRNMMVYGCPESRTKYETCDVTLGNSRNPLGVCYWLRTSVKMYKTWRLNMKESEPTTETTAEQHKPGNFNIIFNSCWVFNCCTMKIHVLLGGALLAALMVSKNDNNLLNFPFFIFYYFSFSYIYLFIAVKLQSCDWLQWNHAQLLW